LINIQNTIKEIDEFKKTHCNKYENNKRNTENKNIEKKNENEYVIKNQNQDKSNYQNYINNDVIKNEYGKITPNFIETNDIKYNSQNNYRKININTRKENSSFYSSKALLGKNNSEHFNNNFNFNNNKNNFNNSSNQNSINYSINKGNMVGLGICRTNSKNKINISSKNSKSKSKSIYNFDNFDTIKTKDKTFESILRKYGGKQISVKVFMNYSKKKPQFFDAPLQKGGISSLEVKDVNRLKRSYSRKTMGNYSTLSITNN
jgi:hypothetical protein